MSEENKLMKISSQLPTFVNDAYESMEKMTKFADLLLESKLCPDHLYQKKKEGNKDVPDYSQGKTSAVVMILIQGYQLDVPPLTAIQHIIPINGLLSIKGILAKRLILNSGKVKKGGWDENITGSLDAEDYKVEITATRSDTDEKMTRSFSVQDAKRAGLWKSKQMVEGQDGWKHKSSPWWKYQKDMIYWRALGNIAKGLFPDVLLGSYITEEAQDMPQDTEMVIETEKGAKITIPDKEHLSERSKGLTEKLTDQITQKNQFEEKKHIEPEPEEKVYTREELEKMEDDIFDFVHENFNEIYGYVWGGKGRKSRKKFIEGVLAYQENGLAGLTESPTEEENVSHTEGEKPIEAKSEDKPDDQKEFDKMMGSGEEEQVEKSDKKVEDTSSSGPISHEGVIISDLPESGSRSFPDKSKVFHGLGDMGIDETRYKEIAGELVDPIGKVTFLSKWDSKEKFAKSASVEQVKELIDVFKSL